MEVNTIKEIQGHVFTHIEVIGEEEIILTRSDGEKLKFHHIQDCCESVYIESIVGDLDDLIDTEVLIAEERVETGENMYSDSCTYTFYTFRTIKGSVDIRWNGVSNGYYSESVDLSKSTDWCYNQ